MGRAPRTPRTPAEFLAPPTPAAKPLYRLDANAPAFVPSFSSESSLAPSNDDSSDGEHADIKARVLASQDRSESASDSDLDGADEDHPNVEYAQLKMKLAGISSSRPGAKPPKPLPMSEIQRLRARLDLVKKNHFFDHDGAEAQYKLAIQKLDDPPRSFPVKPKAPKKRPPNLQPLGSTTPVAGTDVFDEDNEDSDTGMFGLLEEMPTTETSSTGTTIAIRDMALPKHWSGRTSKLLLVELVARMDRYAAVTYSIISGPSRAKRALVSVRWEGRKMEEWRMEDIACYDEGQAEQYIATVALHALTFPSTEGFAASKSSTPTFFRLLPAVYRDLWDELEANRKLNDDTINRSVWSKLRTIIEPKLELNEKSNTKGSRPTLESRDSTYRTMPQVNEALSEQLASGFRARQASSAYQEMLVRNHKFHACFA